METHMPAPPVGILALPPPDRHVRRYGAHRGDEQSRNYVGSTRKILVRPSF